MKIIHETQVYEVKPNSFQEASKEVIQAHKV
jgi:hypothetical protein